MSTKKKKKKNLCINVCNSSKLETAHMSICRWISKLWSISKIEYYSGIRKNRLVTQMCNLISFTQISNTGENSVEKFRTALPLKHGVTDRLWWGMREHGDGNCLYNYRDLGCMSISVCHLQIIYFRQSFHCMEILPQKK